MTDNPDGFSGVRGDLFSGEALVVGEFNGSLLARLKMAKSVLQQQPVVQTRFNGTGAGQKLWHDIFERLGAKDPG
jgi:hypothetical protein